MRRRLHVWHQQTGNKGPSLVAPHVPPQSLELPPNRLGPRLRKVLEHVTGIEEWLGFHMESKSYLDLFPPREKLVYLTSDSPNTLDAWDCSATYIIGGIVDRNRLKGTTMRKAEVRAWVPRGMGRDGSLKTCVGGSMETHTRGFADTLTRPHLPLALACVKNSGKASAPRASPYRST